MIPLWLRASGPGVDSGITIKKRPPLLSLVSRLVGKLVCRRFFSPFGAMETPIANSIPPLRGSPMRRICVMEATVRMMHCRPSSKPFVPAIIPPSLSGRVSKCPLRTTTNRSAPQQSFGTTPFSGLVGRDFWMRARISGLKCSSNSGHSVKKPPLFEVRSRSRTSITSGGFAM